MRTILMRASNAFEHKDWLKARGFAWNAPYWEKLTSSKEEWQEVQAYSRGRFKLAYRDPHSSLDDMFEPSAAEVLERNRRHLAEAKAAAGKVRPEDRPTRDQFYVPGYTSLAEPKPYAKFVRAPFTGHSFGGPRGALSDDTSPGSKVYFSRRKKP